MSAESAIRVAAILWVAFFPTSALPFLHDPSRVPTALFTAGAALGMAWWLWFRPGRGVAIFSAVLSSPWILFASLILTNLSLDFVWRSIPPATIGLMIFGTSVYAAWRWPVDRSPPGEPADPVS